MTRPLPPCAAGAEIGGKRAPFPPQPPSPRRKVAGVYKERAGRTWRRCDSSAGRRLGRYGDQRRALLDDRATGRLDIPVPDGLVSGHHARLEWSGGGALRDLGSSNGTRVNGEEIESCMLAVRQTRRATSTVKGIGAPRPDARTANWLKGSRVATASRKIRVRLASRISRAISLGSSGAWRLPPWRSCGPGSFRPGLDVIRTTIQSESTSVPPVTAERSPPRSPG